jgi:hypothetical protein
MSISTLPIEASVLVGRFVRELDDRAITYCHWKSNEALAASASGENDLDLLVARADLARCRSLLHELGFVHAVQPPSRQIPGVIDYHGHDPGMSRPVHVHLHAVLVLGDDMTKNYRLPIEDAYLASATRQDGFLVPAPEYELLVFVLRMTLKHASWDAVLMAMGRLAASEERELAYLWERASLPDVRRLVDRLVPEVGTDLFDACLAAISGDVGPVRRLLIARRLERALAPFSRRALGQDTVLKITRRVYWLARRRVRPRSRRKGLSHGGLVVAIGGAAEPSERRQVVEQLDAWLRRDLAVLPLSYRAAPRRAARRAARFSGAGGVVLVADHPTGRRARSVLAPPPDLEIVVVDGPGREIASARPGTVHVSREFGLGAVVEAAREALWARL